ncbi:MAG: M23 family metallopeptidase [Patescibacteria group bacterium]
MWKWLKWVLISVGILILAGAIFLLQPWVFLPHKHIEISLPFSPEVDSYTDFIPMGEMLYHDASNGNPNGHPGIDFGWEKETDILAVADGRIINIRKNQDGQYIVEQSLGLYYRTAYQELNKIEPEIRFLAKVKKGQVIGQTGRPHVEGMELQSGGPSRQMHWDFASSSMLIDRLCPIGYFDADSRARIEAIWARVPADDKFKKLYPDICSGYFKDRED